MDLFVSGHQMTALRLDSTDMAESVVQNLTTIQEIDGTYNAMTYSKGIITEQLYRLIPTTLS